MWGWRSPTAQSSVTDSAAVETTLSNPPRNRATLMRPKISLGRAPAATPTIAMLKRFAPSARIPPSWKTKAWRIRTADITIIAGPAPNTAPSKAPPARCVLTPGPTGKLSICAPNTKAPMTPISGTSRSRMVNSRARRPTPSSGSLWSSAVGRTRRTTHPSTGRLRRSSEVHTGADRKPSGICIFSEVAEKIRESTERSEVRKSLWNFLGSTNGSGLSLGSGILGSRGDYGSNHKRARTPPTLHRMEEQTYDLGNRHRYLRGGPHPESRHRHPWTAVGAARIHDPGNRLCASASREPIPAAGRAFRRQGSRDESDWYRLEGWDPVARL